jgi:anti-anti-sigma factor
MSYPLARLDSIAGSADVLPPPFVCASTNEGRAAAWVHVAGELDIATAPLLELALRESLLQGRPVVLDLRELSFMDSSGVHVIVNASNRARHAGRRLVLVRGPPNVHRALTLMAGSNDLEHGYVDAAPPLVEVQVRTPELDRRQDA